MITLTGGTFQDAGGNLLNGILTLVLSADSQETITAPNGQVVSGVPINIVVSNGNVVSTRIWSNAELVVATYYTATLVNSLGEAAFKRPQIWVFSQSNGSSVDLGTVVSSAPPSTAYPAVTSFNNRTGAVVSAPNDYSFAQLSGAITQAQLPGGTTGSGAVVLATSPTLVTPLLGAASATSLAIGTQQLQSDTSRYGTAAIRVQSIGTNAPSVLTLMPSGSSTESDIRMYNTSDPANVGAVEISLLGTTLSFLTENFGTGNKPTIIDLSQFTTTKAAPLITTSTTQLKLQETGDALGITNFYLRNRTGMNGVIVENPSVCLADLGMQTSAIITNIAIDGSNNLTVTAAFAPVASSLPAVGQQVNLSGLTTATFLNGQSVTIATISTTQFTASFTHALYASAADTGTATCQLNLRSEFRNDHVVSTLNTSGEMQFFVVGATAPYLASGLSTTAIGDSISPTIVADFNRALMLISTNAVMNVTRISASMTAAAPAIELAHATSNSSTPDYFWDVFGNNAAGVETLSIRRRTPEFSGVGSDAVIATFDQTGAVSALLGYRVNGAATTGHVLRGNGTNFVDAQLAFSDLSGTATAAQYVTLVGDSGSGGTKGAVPAPSSGDAAAGKFLKADATWAVPGGGSATKLLNYQGLQSPVTPASNVETTLFTYTLPGNTLSLGTGIRITAFIQHTTGATASTYKVDFGATSFTLASGSTGVTAMQYSILIMQDPVTPNSQVISRMISYGPGNTVQAPVAVAATPAETTSGNIIVKITATVTSTTDSYTPQSFLVELVS